MKKSNLFQDLNKSLEEAIAWGQGKIDLRTTTLNLPEKPSKITKKKVEHFR